MVKAAIHSAQEILDSWATTRLATELAIILTTKRVWFRLDVVVSEKIEVENVTPEDDRDPAARSRA